MTRMLKKRRGKKRSCLGKQIPVGATDDRSKAGLGTVEENSRGEQQAKVRRDRLCDRAL